MGYDYKCKKCGEAMHLGKCGVQSGFYVVSTLPTGEAVVKRNGLTVAQGFDNREEAEQWVREQ